MIIRDARSDEMPAVLACYQWLFAAPGSVPPQWDETVAIGRLQQAAASDRSTVLIAVDNDQILGVCAIYLDIMSVRFGQRAWIEDLAVDPDSRSQGVGAQLMDAAGQWAREHGASHVELDSGDARLRAHQFYDNRNPSWTSRCFGWLLDR